MYTCTPLRQEGGAAERSPRRLELIGQDDRQRMAALAWTRLAKHKTGECRPRVCHVERQRTSTRGKAPRHFDMQLPSSSHLKWTGPEGKGTEAGRTSQCSNYDPLGWNPAAEKQSGAPLFLPKPFVIFTSYTMQAR